MINMHKTMLILLAAIAMAGSTASASEYTEKSGTGTSAASLAKLAGLEITDELVVGSVEAARQGILPLANTSMGKTYAVFTEPEDLMFLPPPRFKQQDQGIEELGANLFLSASAAPHFDEGAFYYALFKERAGGRKVPGKAALRPLLIVETKPDEPVRRRNDRKAGSRNTTRKPQVKNQTGNLQWVVKGQSRKDYF